MNADELFTRLLIGLLGSAIAWAAWFVLETVAVRPISIVEAVIGALICVGVYFLFHVVRSVAGRASHPEAMRGALALTVLGGLALAAASADLPESVTAALLFTSIMAGGLILAFSLRTAAVSLVPVAVMAAVAIPELGILLAGLCLAVYLEHNPPAFLNR